MDLLDRLKLDVPIAQAGMGGGVANAELAGAVATAGALGTLGIDPPGALRRGIAQARERAPGRSVAVNLLMPFVHRSHVEVCVGSRVEAVVLFLGGDRDVVERLHAAGSFVLVQVGTTAQARAAIGWGADGLIAQGREAGGHLVGVSSSMDTLATIREVAGGRPVLVAGGIATGSDVRAALDAGAAGVVAGTRFLMTSESAAHPLYKQALLSAERTIETMLFGFGWRARHRVVENAATARWCDAEGAATSVPEVINKATDPLKRVVPLTLMLPLPRLHRPWLPVLSAAPPLAGMPDRSVAASPLYAGETALRISDVRPVSEVVAELAGSLGRSLG